ncbi:MAG: PAS domain S-box protein [Theionarchaea archaeon]|nr:PAS domain S-box protein [Theionarchaea archaeon]MBU7036867.1 PAS domain S-box protein [Theionarchaea archaeon]
MPGYRCDLSAEELELLSQVGQTLRIHEASIAAALRKVLEYKAVYHEHVFSQEELSDISLANVRGLLAALSSGGMYSAPDSIHQLGAQFSHHGLGDKSTVDFLSALQDVCLPLVIQDYPDQECKAAMVTARGISRYVSLFMEGVLAAGRDRILDAQERIVLALEQSLRESEQWLVTTLKSIGDGVIATDTRGKITFMNSVAEQLTDWKEEEAEGKPLAEVFFIINEETREHCSNPFEKIMKTGKVVGLANSTVLIARDGTERMIADSGAPIRDEESNILGTVLVFRDVTEKRKMEDDILRLEREKMESVSILAGGIAHDFNNILTAILGNVTIAKMQTMPDSEIFRLLTEAEKASLRAKSLTQQLLTFSKGGAPVRKPASLAELLKATAEFALSGSKARCEFRIAENLKSADVDAGQISQVINNLMINADQAMPAGGIITIQAENVEVNPKAGLPVKDGPYIKVSIQDEGIGIPEDYLKRIFEPYFSTKQKGSGLGLATSYSIIKNHEGCITVSSKLGSGTTFCIYLPASEKEAPHVEVLPPKGSEGKGRILLMDDEECILEATSEVLSFLGYESEVVRDGVDAVKSYKKAREQNQPFDAVIIDLTIKGKMSGQETIQHLLKIDADVKAIVSSGYSDDPVMANYEEYGFSGVVAKPYTIEELKETLAQVLHR